MSKTEEKIDKILDILTEMRVDVAKNTIDIMHHIKRTDAVESQQKKIIYLLLVGAGIGIALYGPEFLKMLGILL